MAEWLNRIIGYGVEAPDQLLANPLNFRIHPKQQQAATEGSLETLGWIDDVIVNKTTGHVVDGHLRVQLALRKGADFVPVKYVELTEEEERQALLSLDPIAAMAATDKAKLDELIRGVQSDDKRVQEFIAELAEREGIEYGAPPPDDPGAQIDKAEELRVKWGVESGQMWKLGEHRLICGDCTDRAVVERVMGGERAELCPTDPPYNVGFNYDGKTVDDNKDINQYERFTKDWFDLARMLSDRQVITPGCNNLASWLRWFDAFHVATWIKRNTQTHGRVTHFWAWEPVLYFGSGWVRRRQLDIFDYPAQFNTRAETANHPCPKPLEMWADLLESHSEKEAIIYEPFSGSGTTLIACERLARKCRAVEISPAYCAVAIQRWVDMTGGTPELMG